MERWILRGGKADEFAARLGIGKLVGKILSSRMTAEEAEDFLADTKPLSDPMLLEDMELAVPLVKNHLRKHDKIRIIGDYDVDGISASAILVLGLSALGADVDAVIPERIGEGYGFSAGMAENCVRDGVALVITCDTGVREFERANFLAAHGIELIVTDHHDIERVKADDGTEKDLLPFAAAVINAKREGSAFPYREICGAYTAFLLFKALCADVSIDRTLMDRLLSYAAIATVCDVMPLLGENRRLVRRGLEILNSSPAEGIRALCEVGSVKKISVYHLGFVIGPMLNAGGRLSSQNLYVRILLSDDPEECRTLASSLFSLNRERQRLTDEGLDLAYELAGQDPGAVKVIYLPALHESIAGLVAGKLKEKLNRPVFVVTKGENGLKGSGRSIPTYPMFDRMCEISDFFSKFGGHAMAAGFSFEAEPGKEEERVAEMRRLLNERACLSEQDLENVVYLDAAMPMADFTLEDLDRLSVLEPYGTGNPTPVFAEKQLELLGFRVFGSEGKVLRLKLRHGTRISEAILFRKDLLIQLIGEETYYRMASGRPVPEPIFLDICYKAELDEFRGVRSVSFKIQNIRKANSII